MTPFEGTWDCSTWINCTSIIHTLTSKLTTAWFCCRTRHAPPPGASFTAKCSQMGSLSLVLLQAASLEQVLGTKHSSVTGCPCSFHLGHPNHCLLL